MVSGLSSGFESGETSRTNPIYGRWRKLKHCNPAPFDKSRSSIDHYGAFNF